MKNLADLLNRILAPWVLACVFFVGLMLISGCEGYFGKKTDLDFIDVPIYNNRQVAYVPIQPVIGGFVNPVDVIIGFDELLYVADAGTEEIISFDLAGHELGRFKVKGLQAIAMDRRLDLLAIGKIDTVVVNTALTLSCLYRIEQKNAFYGLNSATVTKKVVHPFYFNVSVKPDDQNVSFNGIATRGDNQYYVTRTGFLTPPASYVPDAVLLFDENDHFITTVTVQTDGGFISDYFKKPKGITTLSQPPQISADPRADVGDFIFTSLSTSMVLKVQYIDVVDSDNGLDIRVLELESGDTSKADGYLMKPFRFSSPLDITLSGDGSNYIFVVDGEKDSLYQFTLSGLEGVKPPAGSESSKNIFVSFGGRGTSLTQFNNPTAVAYYDKVVYVADAGNGRVLRFKLTTDFD